MSDYTVKDCLKSIEVMAAHAIWMCDENGCWSSIVMEEIDDTVTDAREIGGECMEFIERIAALRLTGYGPCTADECPQYDMADDITRVAREALGIT